MKMFKFTIASAVALSLAACGGEATDEMATDETAATEEAEVGTVVDVASADDSFSTLVSAVTAAELAETLSGEGPFTVFAPNNAAFEKIDAATLETLTTTETEQLGEILKYHVIPAELNAIGLTTAIQREEEGYTLTTVGGGELTATMDGDAVVLTDAAGNTSRVIATDVAASNGVIHVIDTVLMPE